MSVGTELAIVPQIDEPAALFVAGGLDPYIQGVTEWALRESDGLDISIPADRDKMRSVAYAVSRYATHADDKGKSYKQSITEMVPIIDGERRRMKELLGALKDKIRAPLTEWENRDKVRIEAHEAGIQSISYLLTTLPHDATSAQIEERLLHLDGWAGRGWDEFHERAQKVWRNVAHWLDQRLKDAKKAEAEKAELEKLRAAEAERKQRERDERLQWEAAENARIEAEQAAKAREDRLREAAERAGREQAAAITRAAAERRAAEERANAAEARAKRDAELAVQQERERVERARKAEEAAQAKREANKQHCQRIEREAHQAIVKLLAGFTDADRCLALIEAIKADEIPHIHIDY